MMLEIIFIDRWWDSKKIGQYFYRPIYIFFI